MTLRYGNSNWLSFAFIFSKLYNYAWLVMFDLGGGLNFKIAKNFYTILGQSRWLRSLLIPVLCYFNVIFSTQFPVNPGCFKVMPNRVATFCYLFASMCIANSSEEWQTRQRQDQSTLSMLALIQLVHNSWSGVIVITGSVVFFDYPDDDHSHEIASTAFTIEFGNFPCWLFPFQLRFIFHSFLVSYFFLFLFTTNSLVITSCSIASSDGLR